MRTAAAALIVSVAMVAAPAGVRAGATQVTLQEVLGRAAAYVSDYQKKLQGIVSEEVYRQNVTRLAGGRGVGRSSTVREGRELRSDVLLVKLGGDDWWLQFRDVFEVDRKPVRDRDERLYKLFVNPSANARQMADAIQAESARYNIGPVMRTINIPIMALLFLERHNQPRIEFEQGHAGNVKRFAELAPAAAIWMIEFKEAGKGTMIKGPNGRDLPSRGRVWLDSTDGRILRTELTSADTELRAMVEVSYRAEPALDVLVPSEMREIYNIQRSETRIDGRASYTKFRRFTVTTTERPKS